MSGFHSESPSQHPQDRETSPKDDEKALRWEELRDILKRTVDAIGGEIDDGIMETVVALNALEIYTNASCEGHLDHGVAGPWIDVSADRDDRDITEQIEEKYERADSISERLNGPDAATVSQEEIDEMNRLWDECHILQKEMLIPHLQERAKLADLMAEFYANRHVPYHVQISLQSFGTDTRVMSQGTSLQDIYPDEKRQANLLLYREEMNAFTDFLKKKYFG